MKRAVSSSDLGLPILPNISEHQLVKGQLPFSSLFRRIDANPY